MRRIKGFTLIELLIVVAIIAILAAIAVPNFLEAQVRAKVSRCKNDMRTLATALESYRIDSNQYPPDLQFYQGWAGGGDTTHTDQFGQCNLGRLSTPIAYITSLPDNVFAPKGALPGTDAKRYPYNAENCWRKVIMGTLPPTFTTPNAILQNSSGQTDADFGHLWALASVGPDQFSNAGSYYMFGERVLDRCAPYLPWGIHAGCLYDPTNGTVSDGDIVRVGP